ncbi:MerR family transcriptional regulator [Micromonospora fluostatini]|uniref:MerR family transcriptional regulator n=1 Tax=Micromonospora sp. JCM 30529 TaxID=3421643 RepID=UPI003D17DA73
MWRIGELARMAGVTERTLRHYDKIGLLAPAMVDRATGYRWYGVSELARLERIRGLQHLGLSLRQITDVVDAPDTHLRQALADTVAELRRDIAAKTAAVAAAEDRLAAPTSVLPQMATVGARRLHVRHLRIAHPSALAALCPPPPTTLLTWLDGRPTGDFVAAVTADGGGDRLDLPARTVVRTVVPPATGVVRAGLDLFHWLHRRGLTVAGPTLEEHLVDADHTVATILEIPVRPASPATRHDTDRTRPR